MSKDTEGTPLADDGGTLRPFLLAAMLIVSGLALMEWDDRNDSRSPKSLIQVSQAR